MLLAHHHLQPWFAAVTEVCQLLRSVNAGIVQYNQCCGRLSVARPRVSYITTNMTNIHPVPSDYGQGGLLRGMRI